MGRRQREKLAKYVYDVSKLMMAVPVLATLIAPKFSSMAFWVGIATATVLAVVGYLLDRQPES